MGDAIRRRESGRWIWDGRQRHFSMARPREWAEEDGEIGRNEGETARV